MPKGRLKTELAPKSWTLIKTFSGALCKLGSVCDRTQLFQFQTATLAVVVIHIIIYLFHQFIHRQFLCTIETLRLQHRKEAFHRCIVPTIRLSRHALNHEMLRKQFPLCIALIVVALLSLGVVAALTYQYFSPTILTPKSNVTVPDLRNQTKADALAALKKLGLKTEVVNDASADVQEDHVMGTDPTQIGRASCRERV